MKLPLRRTREEKIERLFGKDVDPQHLDIFVDTTRKVRADLADHDLLEREAALNEFVAQVDEGERIRQLGALFERLPAQRRIDMLAAHLGEEAVAEVLKAQREREVKQGRRKQILESLKEKAHLFHTVDFASIPADVPVRIGLIEKFRFDGKRPSELTQRSAYPRILSFTSLGDANFKLTDDYMKYSGGYPYPPLPKFQEMRLGTLMPTDSTPQFNTTFAYQDRLACEINGETNYVMRGGGYKDDVGLVWVAGEQLFGANIDGPSLPQR